MSGHIIYLINTPTPKKRRRRKEHSQGEFNYTPELKCFSHWTETKDMKTKPRGQCEVCEARVSTAKYASQ